MQVDAVGISVNRDHSPGATEPSLEASQGGNHSHSGAALQSSRWRKERVTYIIKGVVNRRIE